VTRRQLGLFDPVETDPVGAPDPELVALAERLPRNVRFGTSSWTFPGWKGIVYRRSYRSQQDFTRRSLAEYARWPLFRTVGIDRSYYAPVPTDELRDYAAQLPQDFVCVSKVWSEIATWIFPDHPRYGDRAGQPNPHFLDPGLFLAEVAEPTLEGLREHAGPFVIEVSPTPGPVDAEAFAAAVRRFLEAIPAGLELAFELRDRRLLTRAYVAALRDGGASHVFNYHTRMPPLSEQLRMPDVLGAPFVVSRLMIPPGRRYADLKEAWAPFDRIVEPQPAMRDDVVALVDAASERDAEVFVIANNKAEGSSPLTVRALAERLSSR